MDSSTSIAALYNQIFDTKLALGSLIKSKSRPDYETRRIQLEQNLARMSEDLEAHHQEEEHQAAMRSLDEPGLPNPVSPYLTSRSHRPSTSDATLRPHSGFVTYANNGDNGFGGHFASDGAQPTNDWDPTSSSFHNFVSQPTMNFNPPTLPAVEGEASSGCTSSSDHSCAFPSPSMPVSSHNAKKRQRESIDAPGFAGNNGGKSIRTTPSPVVTGNTTPSSTDSFDFPDDPDIYKLLGGNPKYHLREMREDQIAQERALQARREQEREDAEMAKRLSLQFDPTPSNYSEQSGNLNSLSRTTSQSFLDANGNVHRPNPPSKLLARQDTLPKQDYSSKQQTRPSQPDRCDYDNFINLASDDDQDDPVAPTSDPVKTEAGGWRGGGLNLDSHQASAWSDHATIDLSEPSNDVLMPGVQFNTRQAASDFGTNNFGGAGVYNPANSGWGSTITQAGQGVYNATKGAWNTVYGQPSQLPGSFTNTGFETSPYGHGLAGSSANPQIIDLELYEPSQQSEQQNLLTNGYVNPYESGSGDLADRYRDRYNYLTNDPTRTSTEIKDLLENIRPDEELPPENREGTPDAMLYNLMEHQKLGLSWMKSMEEGSNKGGILADDMGLGKTIQALALMVSRRSPDPNRKTTLIVAPVALLKQWEREIKQKLKPQHRLSTYILHGSGRGASWENLKTFDVVLTTFGTLSIEIKRKESIEQFKSENPNWKPMTKADRLPLLGEESKWYRVIIDEAQCIKNRNTRAAQGACALQSLTRFCMSGTPMQNNVTELFSLIKFLRIKPYNTTERFMADFVRPLKSSWPEGKERAMQKLRALLKAILLRRNKKSQIDGQPILQLPERTTECQHAEFDNDEQAVYNALETKTQLTFNKYLRTGTVGRNYSNVLVLLLRLRQACCHPHLIKDFGVASGSLELSAIDMETLAKELPPEAVHRIKEQCAADEQSVLECPVCMDAAMNAIIFIPCGHNTCSECFAKISDPTQAIANGDDGGNSVKCPQCRGKVVLSKVIDFEIFKKVYLSEQAPNDLPDKIQAFKNEDSDTEDDSEESDDSDDSGSDLGGFIVNDDAENEESEDDIGYRKGDTPFERSLKKSKPKKGTKASKGKGPEKKQGPKKTLAQLKKEGARNMKAQKRYLARLRKDWVPSAKTMKTMDILQDIQESGAGEKTIIFSQFTSLLDLLEVPIDERGWKYKRYDGSMSAEARNNAVLEFSDKPDCKIMLVSLRAGNSGLNLVAASQVIIMDPFWNPYVEEQAVDRAHRIGQQKPVRVHRMLIEGTVEDRILALQEKKRAMIESALDENASKEVGRLGIRELGFLFVSLAFAAFLA